MGLSSNRFRVRPGEKGQEDKKNGWRGEGDREGVAERFALIPAVFVGDPLTLVLFSGLRFGHAPRIGQTLPLLTTSAFDQECCTGSAAPALLDPTSRPRHPVSSHPCSLRGDPLSGLAELRRLAGAAGGGGGRSIGSWNRFSYRLF